MKLRHIEIFHAVYVTGSVSGGARALNVSQPTVSKVLKHAEDQLGFALFDRIAGRLTPSEKGVLLFDKIEPLLEQLNDLNRFAYGLKTTKGKHLRFAMTPAFGLEVGPIALAAFSRARSDVVIETETLHGSQLAKALLDETVDIGLVFDAPNYPGIEAVNIGQTGFVCVAPAEMKLPDSETLTLEDMREFPLITLNGKSVLGQILNRRLEDVFEGPLENHIIVETYHLAKRLVKQNAGVAIIDAVTALSGDASGLQFRRLSPPIPINVDVITRQKMSGAKIKTDFIAELQTAMHMFSQRKDHKRLVK
ncbi:LysR family transcriptional regulator [Litorimonas sp. RW-G-Af-16]|uniref:LysR family transcriptional regulator n=1 Tax=Litorimonas sp. RW-G-Af-16 TaxID=3241168 RepID=UPI00390C40B0